MSVLSDKVAVITGASSGIGQAAAVALGRVNAKVVLAARRADRIESLAKTLVKEGSRAVAVPCDVTKRSDVQNVIDTAVADFGRIDVLINNAGIMPLAPMAKCRFDDWDDMIDVNVKGLLYGVGCALPIMLEAGTGHIINVSSVAGRHVFPGAAVYCGTKWAVHAISEGLRSELAELARGDGNSIRVTIIAPGYVETELADSIRDDETRDMSKAYFSQLAHPLTSEDITESIMYALQAPPHVNVNEILIRPSSQVR